MNTIDDATRTTLREWLDLDLDGQLGAAEKVRLEQHLAGDAELRAEQSALGALHAMLTERRVDVAADFKPRVMASLPTAFWESRRAVWWLPVALMATFAIAATALLAVGGAPDHVLGTGQAIVDFVKVSLLAGAGLLTASWRGLGMGIEELFAGSKTGFAIFAIFVICLDLWFVTLLRRRSRRRGTVAVDEAPETSSTRSES